MDDDIGLLIHQTQALSWEELPWKLKSNLEQAKQVSQLMLVGKLITSKPFQKGVIPSLMLNVWHSLLGLSIDDLKDNTYLLHF